MKQERGAEKTAIWGDGRVFCALMSMWVHNNDGNSAQVRHNQMCHREDLTI